VLPRALTPTGYIVFGCDFLDLYPCAHYHFTTAPVQSLADETKSVEKPQAPPPESQSTLGFVAEWLGLSSPKPRENTAKLPLYGDGDKSIRPEAVVQGEVNDCFFMAPLASVAKANPKIISDSIKQNTDGSYTVTFAGAKDKPQTVAALTDEELKNYAKVGAKGTWPAVMEKAFGQYLRDNPAERDKILGHSAGWFLSNPQEYADAGKATEVLRILTGYPPGGIKLADSHSPEAVRRFMTDTFKPVDGAVEIPPVVAGIAKGNEYALKMGLHPEHDYSVLGYEGGMVIVRDPRNKTEANTAGKRMPSENGTFKMTPEDFAKSFDELLAGRTKPMFGSGALIMGPIRLKK